MLSATGVRSNATNWSSGENEGKYSLYIGSETPGIGAATPPALPLNGTDHRSASPWFSRPLCDALVDVYTIVVPEWLHVCAATPGESPVRALNPQLVPSLAAMASES